MRGRIWDPPLCLLTPFAIVALPKCFLKEWRLLIRGYISLTFCSGHYHTAPRRTDVQLENCWIYCTYSTFTVKLNFSRKYRLRRSFAALFVNSSFILISVQTVCTQIWLLNKTLTLEQSDLDARYLLPNRLTYNIRRQTLDICSSELKK